MKKHNFSAGPCVLPRSVMKKASEAVVNFNNLDLSLIEISHRSKDFVYVMENASKILASYHIVSMKSGELNGGTRRQLRQ